VYGGTALQLQACLVMLVTAGLEGKTAIDAVVFALLLLL
jgi:hypothetical protein